MAISDNMLVRGIQSLNDLGLSDVLLPFLLIFTIMFAVLQKTKVLGKDEEGKPHKNYNVIIALIISLLVVIPHVTIGTEDKFDAALTGTNFPDVVEVMNNSLPQISLVAVLIIMVMLLIGILGPEINIAGTSLAGVVAIASFIIVAAIFMASAGVFGQNTKLPEALNFLKDDSTLGMIVVVLMFGLLLWFITSEPKKEEKEGWMESLGKMLTKGNK